jgi:AcrR family transcriptional regulator
VLRPNRANTHKQVSMPKKVDRTVRREAFLAAAYRMIKKHGISGVTARAVAAEAGFTTGALVHYVKSMDELLVEASEFAARDVRANMLAVEELSDPLEALRGVLYLALASDADKRGNWNFFLGFWERSVHNSAVRKITHLRYEEWLKRLSGLIRRAKAEGQVDADVDVTLAARSAMALIDGIAIQVMRSGKPPSTQLQRELIDVWITSWLQPAKGGATT